MNTWNIPRIFVKIIKPQKYRTISSKWIPNACLSLLKIIYYPELISRGFWTGGFCNGSCCFNCPPAGTTEIHFWRRDTVFCWSASSSFKIQNTSNFKLVFNVSLVGDEKSQNLERKLKTSSLNFASCFPLPFHILYIVQKTNCACTGSEFFESFEARWSLWQCCADVVCKGQYQSTFPRAVAVPQNKPTFKYAELVSWSHLKWFTRATLIQYEDKTIAGVPCLRLVDTLRSCMFVLSCPSYFKLYMKLVLCCRITHWCNKYRIEVAKMLKNWPKWGKNWKDCHKKA